MEVQDLSEELLVHVFQWLDLPSLCRVAATCRTFRRVSADDCLWRPFYTAAPFNPWCQPYQASALKRSHEDGAAATLSLRERYAVYARASQLLLQQHTTAQGRVELRAMIVGDKEVGKHALAHVLHKRFKGVSHHICHKKSMHPEDDDVDEEGDGSSWWDNKADDDWTVVGPCLEFGDALVHVTTEVATLSPTNPPSTDQEPGVAGYRQEVRIVRMAECLGVRPDVVVLVFAVNDAASILAVSRRIVPAIRREYNHLPVLLGVAMCHRIGAANYVEVSLYEVVGLGAALKEIIELAIRSSMQQVLQPEKELAQEARRYCGPREPTTLDTIPHIHYSLRCLGCSAMPIVGQAWTCKSCGLMEKGPMCSSCRRDHTRRKVEHRVVPYSAERGVKQKASQEVEGQGQGQGRNRVGEGDQLQLAQVGFSHRNSRFFHHKRQRVDHPQAEASDKEKGVDEIFQLFSRK